MPDHAGFAYWDADDAAHPFPLGEISLTFASGTGAMAAASLALPPSLPGRKTVAERSIGIGGSAQLWFALECTADAQGKVTCEGVFRARHAHWYEGHQEARVGPVQEIRVAASELETGGDREALAEHGPHCDLFLVSWTVQRGAIRAELTVLHFHMPKAAFLVERERARAGAERMPPRRPSTVVPELPDPGAPAPLPMPERKVEQQPAPAPRPSPEPEPRPRPAPPGGAVGKLVSSVRRLTRGLFG